MKDTTISVCLIVRNSAATIVSCLQSVRHLADELVVVDTGSDDATPEIARSFGAKVLSSPWTDDFSAARNGYLPQARCPWILSIDADETLVGWNRDSLCQMLGDNPNTAFVFRIKSYFRLDRVDEFAPPTDSAQPVSPGIAYTVSSTVRLFPNQSGVRYTYPVHESLFPAFRETGIQVRNCPLPIEHFGYLTSQDTASKARFYKALGLKKIAQYPDYFRGYWELGKLFLQDHEYEDATAMFSTCCRINPLFARGWRSLASCLLQQNRYAEAQACLDRAVRRFPFSADLLYLRGLLELRRGNYEAACSRLKTFLKKQPDSLAALLCLAEGYEHSGQLHRAVETLLKAARVAPWLSQPYLSLIGLAEALGDQRLLTDTLDAGKSKAHDPSLFTLYMDVQANLARGGVSHACAH